MGVFMEELLFKSGIRHGQDFEQVEKRGAFPRRGYSCWHCCSFPRISGRGTISQLLKALPVCTYFLCRYSFPVPSADKLVY